MPKYARGFYLTILLIALLSAWTAAAEACRVTITTVPAGAEVIVEGREGALRSPVTLTAAGNSLSIAVRKQGYKEYRAALTLAPGMNHVFVRLSPEGSRFSFLKQFKSGWRPKDLLFSPDGRHLMISLLGDRGLQIYDMATGELKKILLTGFTKTPCVVEGVFTPDGREFWFNQMSTAGMVYVLDMADFRIKKAIPTRGNWSKVGEFSPDGLTYYVTNWLSNDVSVIDALSYSFLRKIKTPGRAPRGLGFSEDGRYLYVVFYDSGEIMKFDLRDKDRLLVRVKNGGTNGRFRIDRTRQIAYINNMRLRKVFIYDLAADKIRGEIRTWVNPNNVQLSPDLRYLYVSNRGPNGPKGYLHPSPVDGRIQVFDAEADFRLVEELPVGNQPIGIAITPDGGTLAISNYMDNTVELYRIEL
ncbi:MAG: YncE family protein [Patescibacteria group bacterium]